MSPPTSTVTTDKKDSTIRTFDIHNPTVEDPTSTIPIHIHEPHLKRSHLGLSTWSSSLVLANQLHKLSLPCQYSKAGSTHAGSSNGADSSQHKGTKILELGAGTALTGLSAACILSDRTCLTLTDLPDVVANLAANVALNASTLKKNNAEVEMGILDWSHPHDLQITHLASHPAKSTSPDGFTGEQEEVVKQHVGKYDIILAADTIYSPEHPAALAATIRYWLRRTRDARVVMAYPLRVAYLEEVRGFWEELEGGEQEENMVVRGGVARGGRMVCVADGREEVDVGTWDDERCVEWCVWGWAGMGHGLENDNEAQ